MESLSGADAFLGKIDEFLEEVAQTHGNSRHASVYRAAAQMAKLQIDLTHTDILKKRINIRLTEKELIEDALRESKAFSKEMREYFYEMAKQRPLTEQEVRLCKSATKILLKSDMCE